METYFILGNWTQKGMAEFKSSPERIDDAREALERMGGAWLGWYLLMGRYDFAVILQVPDVTVMSQSCSRWARGQRGHGNPPGADRRRVSQPHRQAGLTRDPRPHRVCRMP